MKYNFRTATSQPMANDVYGRHYEAIFDPEGVDLTKPGDSGTLMFPLQALIEIETSQRPNPGISQDDLARAKAALTTLKM